MKNLLEEPGKNDINFETSSLTALNHGKVHLFEQWLLSAEEWPTSSLDHCNAEGEFDKLSRKLDEHGDSLPSPTEFRADFTNLVPISGR